MAEPNARRRLAAILAADVVGYSRLIEADEGGTLSALKLRRKTILDPLVAEHHGRIVKVMGDGVLVEFASAVNAVACAVDLQSRWEAANDGLPADRRILLRIGANLGDVVVEGGDLYGEGVIIAVRLQAMADPGGICVSASVHEQVGARLAVAFEDLGPCQVKNIARPVRVFRVKVGKEHAAEPALRQTQPAKASIAILPFSNMSGDPEQQYFSDGITEDIITELARYRSLLVIARNSSFQFRGPSVDLDAVRRRLGVGYIVEGSVRRAGTRVRVTAQLIDASSESHLWAERYDRDIADIFAVQDEVARTIATTLEGRVAASGVGRAERKPPRDWQAYDYFLKGRERSNSFDLAGAESFFAQAVELDPGYTQAHAWRAQALTVLYWLDQQPEQLRLAAASAQRGLSLDDHDASVHHAMGYVAMHQRRFDVAGAHLERALGLNPNDVLIAGDYNNWLTRTGRPGEALQVLDAAMRRDPFPPTYFWEFRFTALFHLKRYEEAIIALRNMVVLHSWHYAYLASACAHAGRLEDARRELAAFLEAKPGATLAVVAAAEPYSDPALLDHVLDGLRKAGLKA